ncbi:MAG: hypothetical protein OXI54_13070 [Chloroflexota bacterium]|nr:hypothetical protein [Chloroflexota bacterium]MDE2685061.1 hypothetical protein [Chloroflexota bacterium]
MFSNASIVGATTAIRTTSIPNRGRKVYYRGYLIHGEIPGISYVIYGRNEFGQVAELGAAQSFPSAMRWVDRHCAQMQRPMPVGTRGTGCSIASHLPAAA